MSQHQKNNQELRVFSWAQQIRPDLWPEGEVDHEGENPDIVVTTDTLCYGVELTVQMHQRSAHSDAAEAQICKLAKGMASLIGIKPGLRVTAAVAGAFAEPIPKRRWPAVADELLRIVSMLDTGTRGVDVSWSHGASIAAGLESTEFEAVWVYHTPGGIDDI